MATVVYLDAEDEITSAAARIRAAADTRVAVVVPFGSRVATSRINFRLLAREAMVNGKRLDIVAPDASARALAASAGIPVFASVGEYEAALNAPDDDDATTVAPAGDQGRATGAAAAGAAGAAAGLAAGAALAGDSTIPGVRPAPRPTPRRKRMRKAGNCSERPAPESRSRGRFRAYREKTRDEAPRPEPEPRSFRRRRSGRSGPRSARASRSARR